MTQKFYQKASVQVAIVTAIGLVVVTTITLMHQRSQLKEENSRLNRETVEKTAEIQRLETLLAPFRTIALQRYTDPEPEALRKLAHRISELENSVAPRSLTDDQTESLLAILNNLPKGGIYVVSRMMDGEAKDYGAEVADVMKQAGWQVRPNSMLADDTVGFGVCSYKSEKKLPGHDMLREAFNRAGIKCSDISIRDKSIPLPPDSTALLIVVGRKK